MDLVISGIYYGYGYGYGYGDGFLFLVFSIIGIPMELLTIGIYSRRDNVVVISGWMT